MAVKAVKHGEISEHQVCRSPCEGYEQGVSHDTILNDSLGPLDRKRAKDSLKAQVCMPVTCSVTI